MLDSIEKRWGVVSGLPYSLEREVVPCPLTQAVSIMDSSASVPRASGSAGPDLPGAIVETIVQQNLGVYKASPSRLQEDVSQEAQVASDYRGRLVYELLQNADDAMESSASDADRVVFVITDDDLWMANSGRPLTDADVQGLCGLGASSKVDAAGTKRASIGHKGLGFKSVLEITDSPAVYSRTLSFGLGASEAWPHVGTLWDELGLPRPSGVPAMRFPTLIGEADDEDRWPALRDNGLNTAFQFPFRQDLASDQREALTDLLLGLPLTTVLFLKHLESVQVQVDQMERSESREWTVSRTIRRDGEWVPVPGLDDSGLYRVVVSSSTGESAVFYIAHDARVPIGTNREGLSGPAWQGVDLTEVSVAALANEPDDGMPQEWRHFHVFLPTEERCPYPMLVNGAFATDLSRQHIRVRADSGDYNSHLVREAARLFVEQMLPELRRESVGRVLSALDRGDDPGGGDAADLLHECLVEVLAGEALIPAESGQVRPIDACALPSPLLEQEGELFRSVLAADAKWGEAEFPIAEFCRGRWARVAADHGAQQLTPSECLTALGTLADPQRASIREHASGGYEVDPVLELSALLWERADAGERSRVEATARVERVFPVHRNDDRSISRVALGDDTAFYPPQSAKRDFPLRGLRFMCHSICWGALTKSERTSMLGDQMRVWSALFDIKEFRFQEVMQASVLPALGLNPTEEELAWRAELRSRESLAAICQLAGSVTKPDLPLRYQRLQSDRAIFNLSRLPVPCVDGEGGERWVPAYQAYFGRSWLGDASFEHVVDAIPDDAAINAHFLVGPEEFVGLLDSAEEASTVTTESDDDEVDLNEDVDRSLETTESERWLNFLSWIGVNRSLRLVHFHDVEDRDSGWLTTKDLQQPKGWAFRDLGETWRDYCDELKARLADRPDHDEVVPYLYEAHDLDHALPLIEAAELDASAEIASRLFEHLILNWATYAPFADAQVALVKAWRWPAARSKPQRAMPEEITSVGDNLWLFRLRTRSICPTSRGPRTPGVTWSRTPELERRFSSARGRRDASDLVPVIKQSPALPTNALRAFCERLGIRTEVSPSTFTIEDADLLCRQIERLYSNATVGSAALRHVIKPAYRSMFELLSGKAGTVGVPPLEDTPLLAERADSHQFLPAREVLFASTPGIKERSGIAGRVPVFVLEAEAPAVAPLRSVFGCRDLERALEWTPNPGECPFDSSERVEIHRGLNRLVAPLLARIRAERTNPRDRQNLVDFVERIEPVDDLDVTCTLDEVPLERQPGHGYYVQPRTASQDFLGFVVWAGPPWPPSPDTAQSLAMALADALGVNLVETLLAFINSDDLQRQQLLRIAGASGHYHDVCAELAEGPLEPPPGRNGGGSINVEPTPAPEPLRREERTPSGPGTPPPAAPPVPLHAFDALLLDGEPLIVTGEQIDANSRQDQIRRSKSPSGARTPNPAATGPPVNAPAGTDLSALDSLGMKITATYELRRLERFGGPVAAITGGELHNITGSRTRDTLVVEVHTPKAIARAEALSETVKRVMQELEVQGISRVHPGFDLLSIRDGEIDRLIELKSSGVDARVQAMSWNEWKSASNSRLRSKFWLYLVGNLRADLDHASPYVRAINDPFGSLASETVEDQQLKRAVQLRVREFASAEHLDLTVTRAAEGLPPPS